MSTTLTVQDREQLRMLSIGHYVLGGLAVVYALFMLAYLLFGGVVVGIGLGQDDADGPAAALMGLLFALLGLGLSCIGWIVAILLFTAGKRLAERRSRVFCLVVAGIACTSFPLGTVLGVFTILVLSRESVRLAFDATSAPSVSGTARSAGP